MSEETAAPQAQEASTSKTLLVGCSIVIWILAIFMIITLNNIKSELTKLNSNVEMLMQSPANSTSLAGYQIKDAEGNVVYSFATKPMEMMEEGSMADGASCPAPAK
jgi:hypothetical protein